MAGMLAIAAETYLPTWYSNRIGDSGIAVWGQERADSDGRRGIGWMSWRVKGTSDIAAVPA
jgi:hypothetical protein